MPARRRAPMGCGPQARWLRCSLLTYHTGYARRSRLASGPGGRSKVQTLFIDRPLPLRECDFADTILARSDGMLLLQTCESPISCFG